MLGNHDDEDDDDDDVDDDDDDDDNDDDDDDLHLGLHDKGKLAKFTTLDVAALDPTLQALLHHQLDDLKTDYHDDHRDDVNQVDNFCDQTKRICVEEHLVNKLEATTAEARGDKSWLTLLIIFIMLMMVIMVTMVIIW